MFKINLVPESKQQIRRIQKTNLTTTFIVVGIMAVLLVTILVLQGIKIAKTSSVNNLSKSIDKTEKELDKYEDLEKTVISLQEGLKGVEQITKGSSKWTKLFTEIEKATPKDVSFATLSVKGFQITANVEGKDIDSLARFSDSFGSYKMKDTENKLFKNVDISGYTKVDDGRVKFDVKMDIVKEVLWP